MATYEKTKRESRLEGRRTGANNVGLKRERDNLKCEIEKLRRQYNGIGMIKANLNNVRVERDKIRRERRSEEEYGRPES
jgi:hypothetical protein